MPDIKHSIVIEAAPERIYPLIASGQGFAQWWAEDVTEEKATGLVDLGFFKRATLYRLQPAKLSPAGAEWLCQTGKEWQGTKLLFALAPADGRTQLRFTHAHWQAETDYFVSCNTTWGGLIFRLKAAAEGKGQGPLFTSGGMAY